VLAAVVAGGCGKKDDAGGGSGGGAASAPGTATASGTAAAPVVPDAAAAAAAPAVRADVAAFVAVFDPINSRLDHVARARTACEKRRELLDAVNAIDKNTPPAGRDAAAWLAAVEKLQVIIDDTGEPCDDGNIKGIEAKLDDAKKALDAVVAP
jgi:hypothetical protein